MFDFYITCPRQPGRNETNKTEHCTTICNDCCLLIITFISKLLFSFVRCSLLIKTISHLTSTRPLSESDIAGGGTWRRQKEPGGGLFSPPSSDAPAQQKLRREKKMRKNLICYGYSRAIKMYCLTSSKQLEYCLRCWREWKFMISRRRKGCIRGLYHFTAATKMSISIKGAQKKVQFRVEWIFPKTFKQTQLSFEQ